MTTRDGAARRPQRRLGWPLAAMLAVSLAGGGAAGCRRPPVQTVPSLPDLDVPPPPLRIVEAPDAQAPPPVSLVDAPARTVERPRVPPPPPPRDAKPDPRPDPVVEAKPPDEPRPATTLQTTPADREGEVDRRVRGTLQTAAADLNRVDYRKLNADVQMQYDTAKSFMRQAEEALKSKNLVFALTMAEKAATLASQLAGR